MEIVASTSVVGKAVRVNARMKSLMVHLKKVCSLKRNGIANETRNYQPAGFLRWSTLALPVHQVRAAQAQAQAHRMLLLAQTRIALQYDQSESESPINGQSSEAEDGVKNATDIANVSGESNITNSNITESAICQQFHGNRF